MCFSPAASFTGAGVLSVAAAATLYKAWRHDRAMLGYAVFPAIFAAHQATEGMVWLTLDDDVLGMKYRYIYLIVAFLLWPILCPLASYISEPKPQRRRIMLALLGTGIALAIYIGGKLIFDATHIDVVRLQHSLCYTVQPDAKKPPGWVDGIYGFVVIAAMSLSSNNRIKLFGGAVALTYGLTFMFLHAVYFSTWCMFSAVLSVMLYTAIGRAHRPEFSAAEDRASARQWAIAGRLSVRKRQIDRV